MRGVAVSGPAKKPRPRRAHSAWVERNSQFEAQRQRTMPGISAAPVVCGEGGCLVRCLPRDLESHRGRAHGVVRDPGQVLTLDEVLSKLGIAHERVSGGNGFTHSHSRNGVEVFRGNAGAAWEWLRTTGQYIAPPVVL